MFLRCLTDPVRCYFAGEVRSFAHPQTSFPNMVDGVFLKSPTQLQCLCVRHFACAGLRRRHTCPKCCPALLRFRRLCDHRTPRSSVVSVVVSCLMLGLFYRYSECVVLLRATGMWLRNEPLFTCADHSYGLTSGGESDELTTVLRSLAIKTRSAALFESLCARTGRELGLR